MDFAMTDSRNCGEVCKEGEARIVYGWARNAPPLNMPSGEYGRLRQRSYSSQRGEDEISGRTVKLVQNSSFKRMRHFSG